MNLIVRGWQARINKYHMQIENKSTVVQQEDAVKLLESEGYRRVDWHSETPRHVCVDVDGKVYGHLSLSDGRFAVMMAR